MHSEVKTISTTTMTSPPPTPFNSSNINIYYFIIVATFFMVLIVAALLLYSCRCRTVESLWQCLTCRINRGPSVAVVETIPVCRYKEKQSFSSECSVCLTEFEEGEKVRQLPTCRHSFHAPCIDMWLCSHSSCPSCRALVPQAPVGCQITEAMEDISQQQQLMENRGVAVATAFAL